MTRTGSGMANVETKSTCSPSRQPASSSSTIERANGSYRFAAAGLNAREMSRRLRVWPGGSSVSSVGTSPIPSGASSSIAAVSSGDGGTVPSDPASDEKVPTSPATRRTSSWRVISQNPLPWGTHVAPGPSRRAS